MRMVTASAAGNQGQGRRELRQAERRQLALSPVSRHMGARPRPHRGSAAPAAAGSGRRMAFHPHAGAAWLLPEKHMAKRPCLIASSHSGRDIYPAAAPDAAGPPPPPSLRFQVALALGKKIKHICCSSQAGRARPSDMGAAKWKRR